MIKSSILIFTIVVLSISPFSKKLQAQKGKQTYTTSSKKARKAFDGAITFFQSKHYADAQDYLNKALKYDSNFVEVYILQGQIWQEQHDTYKAISCYKKAAEVNPDFYPKVFYMLATMEQKQGYYADALEHYKMYAQRLDADPSLRRSIERGVDMCQFAVNQMANPVPFDPQNLGNNVNTENDEYINTISVDDKMLILTQRHKASSQNYDSDDGYTEDFLYSRKSKNGLWSPLYSLRGFNTNGNEGAMSVSPDGRFRVFTACHRRDGFGSCDLYYSYKRGNKWSMPSNMGAGVNTRWWETNSTISSDGKTIYFVSNRKGGYGKSDIWKISLQADGTWANPENLGPEINTPGSEMTPFIHPDGKTLYFASNGHIGMGGYDLFVSSKDHKERWGHPVNLGYPINTLDNEMGIVLNAKGDLAYISADRKEGFGGFDVYSFELYEQVRPTAVTYMRGIVRDAETKKPLKASFQLVNLENQQQILQSKSDDEKGDFLVVIPVDAVLLLTVECEGYLFYSERFNVKSGDYTNLKPFLKNVDLNPIKAGQSTVLKNIYFASRSYNLEDESLVELNKLYELLEKNKSLSIQISGHTDNIGDDNENLILSRNRAKAVMEYLLSKGIEKSRLSYKGYGERKPIADNNTDEGRAKNRRTEIMVVGI